MIYIPKVLRKKLQPCPYCGKKTYIFTTEEQNGTLYGISCAKCKELCVGGYICKEDARIHWNLWANQIRREIKHDKFIANFVKFEKQRGENMSERCIFCKKEIPDGEERGRVLTRRGGAVCKDCFERLWNLPKEEDEDD